MRVEARFALCKVPRSGPVERELPGRLGTRDINHGGGSGSSSGSLAHARGDNTRLQDENRRLRTDLETAAERVAAADTVRERLAEARSDLDLLASPSSSVHALAGTESLPQARARIFLDPATGRAILFAYELPILPPDTVYELWAIRSGTPRAAGVFRPDPDGQARLEITDASLLEGLDVLAVTVEPAPGTEQPTSQPVLISSS